MVLLLSSIQRVFLDDFGPETSVSYRSELCYRKIPHSHQVVCRCCKCEDPPYLARASVAKLSKGGYGFDPTENLLDPLALALTYIVALMACCSPIDSQVQFLGNMGSNHQPTAFFGKTLGVVSFIGSHRGPAPPRCLPEQLYGRFSFAGSCCLSNTGIDHKTVAVLYQDMAAKTQL